MATVPHAVPTRTAHAIAALYGVEDDTLVAWQRFCAQTVEALRPQHDPERLSKALALAQGGHVEVEEDGCAVVTSGTQLYHVQADGTCDCPDSQHRGAPCKHGLAVLIHTRAQALAAPSPRPAPAASAPAQLPPRRSAAWDVHEAPVSSCFKIRVGAFEWTHTMRGADDAELHTRLRDFVPTFRDVVAALDVLQAEREAAKAAPVLPPPPAPATPAGALPQPDMPTLLQAALQQMLASPNGHAVSSPPPAPSAPAPDDQQTGFCSLHQVPMAQKQNARGTFYGHWLADEQRHCNGRRNSRR